MSTSTPAEVGAGPDARSPAEPKLFFWCASFAWMAFLGWSISQHPEEISQHALELLPWVAAMLVLNLVPVRSWSAFFSPDIPLIIASALVLTPLQAATVGFLGCFGRDELTGEAPLSRALYNHCQGGLTAFSAAVVVNAIATFPPPPLLLFPLAFAALLGLLVNYVLVAVALSIKHTMSFRRVLARMQVGNPLDFLLTHVAWALLGGMIAILYDQVRFMALIAAVGVGLLGRQVLIRGQMYIDAHRAYKARENALARMSLQISQERSDERKLIAANLHDEVLQPLFKVTLMAHVLKSDLAEGRLLEMDEDVPQLLAAAELAASSLRDLVGDLRRSTLGGGGLTLALSNLVRTLRRQTPIPIESQLQEVNASEEIELIAYQIGKEALSNAIAHSRATHVQMKLEMKDQYLYLQVEDDGAGFDPYIDREGHYGMHIMRERADSIQGNLFVDSSPGAGCSVTFICPTQPAPPGGQ